MSSNGPFYKVARAEDAYGTHFSLKSPPILNITVLSKKKPFHPLYNSSISNVLASKILLTRKKDL